MISIIIPVHNCEKTICRCLSSILNQTYNNFEIIIIDDGSIDNTYKKCLIYQELDARIKLFRNDKNHGVSWSRNFGIQQAEGEFICFVDADDEFASIYALSALYHPEYDLTCGNFQLFRDGNISYNKYHLCNELTSLNRTRFREEIHAYIACPRGTNNLFSAVWAKLHRTSIIKKNKLQFSEKMTKDEVVAFSIDYATYVNNCLLVPDIVYKYYTTDEMAYYSKYQKGKGDMVFNMVATFRAAEKLLNKMAVEETEKNRLLVKFMNYYLNRYLYYNNLLEFVE